MMQTTRRLTSLFPSTRQDNFIEPYNGQDPTDQWVRNNKFWATDWCVVGVVVELLLVLPFDVGAHERCSFFNYCRSFYTTPHRQF
jgi:hypothetical protein